MTRDEFKKWVLAYRLDKPTRAESCKVSRMRHVIAKYDYMCMDHYYVARTLEINPSLSGIDDEDYFALLTALTEGSI